MTLHGYCAGDGRPDAMDGQWMTYTEAAVRLGVTPEAVREAHIAALETDLERLTAELAGERAGRQSEVELLKGQLVTERERAYRAVTDLTGERAARQADQEQLAAARAAADRATAELVELAKRLAARRRKLLPNQSRRVTGQFARGAGCKRRPDSPPRGAGLAL